MKKMMNEFKQFAIKGNVIDLAIGVIIGTAFNRIVTSLVEDIIMPPLAAVVGGFKFDEYKIVLSSAISDATGKITKSAVSINYGNFIQIVFNFLVVTLSIFCVVKVVNHLQEKKQAEEEASSATSKQPTETELLIEIRDLLKKK